MKTLCQFDDMWLALRDKLTALMSGADAVASACRSTRVDRRDDEQCARHRLRQRSAWIGSPAQEYY